MQIESGGGFGEGICSGWVFRIEVSGAGRSGVETRYVSAVEGDDETEVFWR